MTTWEWVYFWSACCVIGMAIAYLMYQARRPVRRTPIYLDNHEMARLMADLDQLPTTAEDDTR
jgi:hypothetical protein